MHMRMMDCVMKSVNFYLALIVEKLNLTDSIVKRLH